MKKLLPIVCVYTLIIFIITVVCSMFIPVQEEILLVQLKMYRFNRGLLWFLGTLPAIFISGFTVGCCIQWKTGSGNSVNRFSPAMMDRFKVVFIVALVMTLFLTLAKEILCPIIERKQEIARNNPSEIKKDIDLSRYYLNEEEEFLAWQYAEMAYSIDPTDPEAQAIYSITHNAMEKTLIEIRKENVAVEKIEKPLEAKDNAYTPKVLIEKSREARDKENWFDAHYWATLAVKGSKATDLIHTIAIEEANYAWNRLGEAGGFNNEEEKAYYARKKEGYSALNSGNYLKAYYLYQDMLRTNELKGRAEDPDIIRYLALSKEQLENQYFFIDETENMDKLDVDRDIYFSLHMSEGGSCVFYIGRMASVKKAAGYVRYISDLNMVFYDEDGNFEYSLKVPFAKALAISSSYFGEDTKKAMGITKDMDNILELQLVSVDRETEGVISRPVYSYTETGIPFAKKGALIDSEVFAGFKNGAVNSVNESVDKKIVEEKNVMLLAMNYDDFAVLSEVSHGSKTMNLLVLNNFLSKCERYGYSAEVYIQSLVSRGSYPLLVLCMIVFAASLAWNYRFEDEKAVFKFRWLFFLPVLFMVTYLFIEIAIYVANVVTFVIVGMAGGLALMVTFIIYIIILIALSIMFLARKAD